MIKAAMVNSFGLALFFATGRAVPPGKRWGCRLRNPAHLYAAIKRQVAKDPLSGFLATILCRVYMSVFA
jgi:hypothetical protein